MTLRFGAFGLVLLFTFAGATPAPEAAAPGVEVGLGTDAESEGPYLRATPGETPSFRIGVPDGATLRVDSALVLHNLAQETRWVSLRVDAPPMPAVHLVLTSAGEPTGSIELAPGERVELGFTATQIPGNAGRTTTFAIVIAYA